MKLRSILFNEKNTTMPIAYTAIVLTKEYRDRLLEAISPEYMEGKKDWELILHHVTLNMGPYKGNREEDLGRMVAFSTRTYLEDDKVSAVSVQLPGFITSQNAHPHITVAVNRAAGGKPVMSNNLPWGNSEDERPFAWDLEGTLEEVPQQKK